MAKILIAVSTRNRLDLTGLTLDSVFRNRTKGAHVLVLDDASNAYDEAWFKQWRCELVRREQPVGVAEAARERFKQFLMRGYDYLVALDNDVLTSKGFDSKCCAIFVGANDHCLTVASGYKSCTQRILHRHPVHDEVSTIGGLCQTVDRVTAGKIMDRMPEWKHNWDATLSRLATRMVVPKTSLLEHLGVHGSGVNGRSTDVAVDFPYA